MAETRKLATILALDVAGYSKAAEQDDSAAADAVRRLRAVIVEIVAPFGGRIFSSAGDGFMLEFHSAVAGVQAAMALLTESKSGARDLPEIRIGVHLGDVIVEENGDLMGHGVNVAARLQVLAEPGSAVVSEAVHAQVRSAAALPFTPHGRVQLDKMSERIAVYSLAPGPAPRFAGIVRRQSRSAVLVLAGVVLLGVAALAASALWNTPRSGLVTSVSLYQDGEPERTRRITHIGFASERDARGRLTIRADFPYRERLERDHRIDGLVFNNTPFLPGLPRLLVQVTNTTAAPLTINEAQFEVVRATPNRRPLLTARERAIEVGQIVMFNEGWAEPADLRLAIDAWGLPQEAAERVRRVSGAGVESDEPCAEPTQVVRPPAAQAIAPADEAGAYVFDLTDRIPAAFNGAPFVCALGTLSYRAEGQNVALALRTRVSNRRPDVSIAPMVVTPYDLYLDPERQNYVAVVPALHEIAPGETANIVLTVLSERSSTFVLRPSVRTADGATVDGDAFELEVVALRSSRAFALNEERRMAVPAAAIQAEDPEDWIETASYDPQGREAVVFHARSSADEARCMAFLNGVGARILRRAGVAQTRAQIVTGDDDILCTTGAD